MIITQGEVLPSMDYIGVCGPEEYGFSPSVYFFPLAWH